MEKNELEVLERMERAALRAHRRGFRRRDGHVLPDNGDDEEDIGTPMVPAAVSQAPLRLLSSKGAANFVRDAIHGRFTRNFEDRCLMAAAKAHVSGVGNGEER